MDADIIWTNLKKPAASLDSLPMEIHARIIAFLSVLDRWKLAQVNKYWRSVVGAEGFKLTFTNATIEWDSYRLTLRHIAMLRDEDFLLMKIYDWKKIVNLIEMISSFSHVKCLRIVGTYGWFRSLRGVDEINWSEFGKYLNRCEEMAIICEEMLTKNVEELVRYTSLLRSFEVNVSWETKASDSDLIKNLFSNNEHLQHVLIFKNTISSFDENIKYRKMETIVVENTHFVGQCEKMWQWLRKSESISTLKILFTSRPRFALNGDECFANLRDLRLENVDGDAGIEQLGGEKQFPVLEAFTLNFRWCNGDIGDFKCIFTQNNKLRALRTNLEFTLESQLTQLCQRYNHLKYITVSPRFLLTEVGFVSFELLKSLEYLVWNESDRLRLDDEMRDSQMCRVVETFRNVRVLRAPKHRLGFQKFTRQKLRNFISTFPNESFFLEAKGVHLLFLTNVVDMNPITYDYKQLLSLRAYPKELYSHFAEDATLDKFLKRVYER